MVVTSRVKDCESALESVRRRQEGATFDRKRPELYSLTRLHDLAGVRVLVFPHSRIDETNRRLRERFSSWTADPVPGFRESDEPLALKYFGYCEASERVRAEFQIVPMLTALFWEVEHSVMYKPSPHLKGAARSLEMQQRTQDVLKALKAFEDEFADLIRRDPLSRKKRKKKKKKRQ